MSNNNIVYDNIVAIDYIVLDDRMWIGSTNMNVLVELDFKTKKNILNRKFPSDSMEETVTRGNVLENKGKLFFEPRELCQVDVYNINKDEFEIIKIDESYINNKIQKGALFLNSFIDNNNLYLVGFKYAAIVKINLENYTIEYLTSPYEKIDSTLGGSQYGYFSLGQVIGENKVLLPITEMNAVLEFELSTNKSEIIKLDLQYEGIGTIYSYDGKNIWLTGRGKNSNKITCWNRDTGKIKQIELPILESQYVLHTVFNVPVYKENKLYLFPSTEKLFFEIDINTNEIVNIDIFQNEEHFNYFSVNFEKIRMYDDIIGFFSRKFLKYYEYNIKTKETNSFSIGLNNDEWLKEYTNQYIQESLIKQSIIAEKNIPFLNFAKFVKIDNKIDIIEGEKTFGTKIFESICK